MFRHSIIASFLILSACAPRPQPSAEPPCRTTKYGQMHQNSVTIRAENPAIGLVTVALVVDQLAAWIADSRLELLPASGGFARLRHEGTWYRDVRFAYAITETAPGHASLYSGMVPREHGIVANELWTAGHASGILVDSTTHVVTDEGEGTETGSSAIALKSEVVADRFKAQNPAAKVYSFSLKDRGAIFGGGQHPDLALWYDAKLGRFVSSTAFTQKFPDWVVPAIGPGIIKQHIDQPWTLMDANWVSGLSFMKDDQAGEADFANYGIVFPHRANVSTQPLVAFRANPESDRALLELGLLALDHTPGDNPVMLAISLSANDYIGHLFGPHSWEAWDELRRLDASLAWFFSELNRRKGTARWSVVLSADHGVLPLPEVGRAAANQRHDGHESGLCAQELTERLLPANLEKTAREAANKTLGKGEWIAALIDPYLYLSDKAKSLDAARLVSLRGAVTAALEKVPGVAQMFDTTALPSICPTYADDSLAALVCRSVQPGRGGDYFIALKPGYFFDTSYVPGFGTSHGNTELCNRSVPLLVRGLNQSNPGKVVDFPQSFGLFRQQLEELLSRR